jgi:hypothetical protein
MTLVSQPAAVVKPTGSTGAAAPADRSGQGPPALAVTGTGLGLWAPWFSVGR